MKKHELLALCSCILHGKGIVDPVKEAHRIIGLSRVSLGKKLIPQYLSTPVQPIPKPAMLDTPDGSVRGFDFEKPGEFVGTIKDGKLEVAGAPAPTAKCHCGEDQIPLNGSWTCKNNHGPAAGFQRLPPVDGFQGTLSANPTPVPVVTVDQNLPDASEPKKKGRPKKTAPADPTQPMNFEVDHPKPTQTPLSAATKQAVADTLRQLEADHPKPVLNDPMQEEFTIMVNGWDDAMIVKQYENISKKTWQQEPMGDLKAFVVNALMGRAGR